MVGTLDSQVIEKFKEFKKQTNQYHDLKIEEIKFENISLSNEEYFKFIKGKNKYIQRYITKNLGDYPILGASLKNDCISNYIKPLEDEDIVDKVCVSFNKDNAKGSKPFYRDYPFLMDRHHIAIVSFDNILPKYLYHSLRYYFEKSKFGWGDNVASVDEVQKHFVPVPADYKEYKSIDIQNIIVEFLEYSFNNIDRIEQNIDKQFNIVNEMRKSLIPSTFKKIAIKNKFRKYAKENGINLDISDIEFDIKKIYSKNEDEIICQKRMGFTPERTITGDISWYNIEDLDNENISDEQIKLKEIKQEYRKAFNKKYLHINTPNTEEKTTIELIRKKVDPKGTGKSEKLISIQKGDILVSFKLTVGVVKIYNSDKPAYCNEAIDILNVNSDYDKEYIAYNCMLEYPKNGNKTSNGITLNDDAKAKIKIFKPKPLNGYSSYQIQKILSTFISDIDNELQEKYFNKLKRGYEVAQELRRTYLARTFSLIEWSK